MSRTEGKVIQAERTERKKAPKSLKTTAQPG